MENEIMQDLVEQFKPLNNHLEEIVEHIDRLNIKLGEIRDKIYGGGVL
jgi:hypothetical protein